LTGRDIVCLSTHYWDGRRFRKQEFMSRFAARNRVLYVEPSFSMARSPAPHVREVAQNRWFLPRLESRTYALSLMKPPRGLPKWTEPRLRRVNYRWYAHLIREAEQRLQFRNTILWIYNPRYANAIQSIPHDYLVTDLVDDIPAYPGMGERTAADLTECIEELARRSDLFVATAKPLLRRYGRGARRVEYIPNGFDATRFSILNLRGEPPAALKHIPRPIIGFVGSLFAFLDFALLGRIARVHRDKSLVLVGRVAPEVCKSVARLERLPNVFYLGEQDPRSIPAYIQAFDVCVNPFRAGRVADSVSPLKVYEYLAMGRPVVSTPMASLRDDATGSVIGFARDAAEFCGQIERSLRADQPSAAKLRQDAVAAHSWDRLFSRVDAACDAALKN
jgi:glycosyltransferase involved in cell wall biosynthesis